MSIHNTPPCLTCGLNQRLAGLDIELPIKNWSDCNKVLHGGGVGTMEGRGDIIGEEVK